MLENLGKKKYSASVACIFGSVKLQNISVEKKHHTWSIQILDKLLDCALKWEHSGHYSIWFGCQLKSLEDEMGMVPSQPKTESAFLDAAKKGTVEIVEKVFERCPMAIHDVNAEKRNAVHLAVEHRQPRMYHTLLKIPTSIKDQIFSKVDCEGNSALHLAAMLRDYRPWNIPNAALLMQWEMEWFQYSLWKTACQKISLLRATFWRRPQSKYSDTQGASKRS
ncbi:uncharacterized protein LOC131160612 [Malania oleifera]|uniref:uncharacterized protein LOC131160612 n=1 Tax=Malania oleifera TaxID=397392 RepID=UPI0025AE33A9|nr:uncharacterized protein LOC131160612 [Malania oleifera]XP_057972431.1 uncharacterized protein LOC131160612 [Malania oleifera]